jgi:hypothetical protein
MEKVQFKIYSSIRKLVPMLLSSTTVIAFYPILL